MLENGGIITWDLCGRAKRQPMLPAMCAVGPLEWQKEMAPEAHGEQRGDFLCTYDDVSLLSEVITVGISFLVLACLICFPFLSI